jgi:two-component system, chemotaxis family, chemotaxis protein CheY
MSLAHIEVLDDPILNNAPPPLRPNWPILADNDLLMRGVLHAVISAAGPQVCVAGDGREAVNQARRFVAELVLLDLHMPRLDGLGACAEIRELPGYADTPILLITADKSPNVPALARRAGATEVLYKPILIVDLMVVLRRYLTIVRR